MFDDFRYWLFRHQDYECADAMNTLVIEECINEMERLMDRVDYLQSKVEKLVEYDQLNR